MLCNGQFLDIDQPVNGLSLSQVLVLIMGFWIFWSTMLCVGSNYMCVCVMLLTSWLCAKLA
jgi:hypothetical protein